MRNALVDTVIVDIVDTECCDIALQLVKAGLALGLFGGTHRFLDDKVIYILT